jgi:hypothetical protein
MRKLMLLATILALVLVLVIPTVAQANNTGSFTNQQGTFGVGSTSNVEVGGNGSTLNLVGNGGASFTIGGADNESGSITTTSDVSIP